MTAQSNNTLLFESKEYEVTAKCGGDLFDPKRFGFSPVPPHTGCWSGFNCLYAVEKDQLVLETLWICHGNPQAGYTRELWPLPKFAGVAANERYDTENRYQEFQGKYEQLNFPLDFSGSILISAENSTEGPNFRGFPRPWHFNTVRKLSFQAGHLRENRDVSSILKTFDTRYCIEGDFYGEHRRNGKRFLARHIGSGFDI